MERIGYIVRAKASAMQPAEYFAAETELNAKEIREMLDDTGWTNIEIREITKRDNHIEGILKRCSLGSDRERANLQILFNEQEARPC